MTIAIAYIWALLGKVAGHRYSLYSVFLMVPSGYVRALATKNANVDVDDEADDEDDRDIALIGIPAGPPANDRSKKHGVSAGYCCTCLSMQTALVAFLHATCQQQLDECMLEPAVNCRRKQQGPPRKFSHVRARSYPTSPTGQKVRHASQYRSYIHAARSSRPLSMHIVAYLVLVVAI
jgi:hypothetical protein